MGELEEIAKIVAQAVNMALAGVNAPGRLDPKDEGATYYASAILRLIALARAPDAGLRMALEELADAVFGREPGDEPDVYADYDRLCDLQRRAREALSADALARASVAEGDQEVSASVAESAAQGTDSLAAPEAVPTGWKTRDFVRRFFELRLSEKRELFERYELPMGDPTMRDADRWTEGLKIAKERGLLPVLAEHLPPYAPAKAVKP